MMGLSTIWGMGCVVVHIYKGNTLKPCIDCRRPYMVQQRNPSHIYVGWVALLNQLLFQTSDNQQDFIQSCTDVTKWFQCRDNWLLCRETFIRGNQCVALPSCAPLLSAMLVNKDQHVQDGSPLPWHRMLCKCANMLYTSGAKDTRGIIDAFLCVQTFVQY